MAIGHVGSECNTLGVEEGKCRAEARRHILQHWQCSGGGIYPDPIGTPPFPGGESAIRLDTDVLEYFRDAVDRAGGGNYQTLINKALREFIDGEKKPTLEDTLRRVIREELRTAP